MRRWRSVGYKVFVLYFVSMTVSIAFMGFFFYRKASDIIQTKVSEVALQTIQQANRRLEMIFEEYDNRTQLLLGYKELQKGILDDFHDSYEHNQNTVQITNFLSNLVNSKNDTIHAYMFGEHAASYRYSVNESPTIAELPPIDEAGQSQDWYKKIKAAKGRTVWFGIQPSLIHREAADDDKQPVFCLGRAITNLDHVNEVIGVMILEVKPDKVQHILSQIDFHELGTTVIVDQDNRVVADSADSMRMSFSGFRLPPIKSGIEHTAIRGEETITVFDEMSIPGWKLVGMAPAKRLVQDTNKIGLYTLYLALGFMVVSVILAFFAAREMHRPVKMLLHSMRKAREGDFQVRITNRRQDEFGLLFDGFNIMVTHIKELIDELYVQRLLKKETQLKMLASQMNAHFLYNTLDSIHWISRIHKVDKISEMIFGLSKYLRISLSEGKDLVTVRESVELVESYLLIQKSRYEDKFEVNIELEPDLLERKVLKFVFQPLVENAIYHGLENKKEKGHLDIRWQRTDDILCFEVIDDGAGIRSDKLNELNEVLAHQDVLVDDNFAIKNINTQIKLAYGRQYGLSIESEPGAGTKVTMKFPLRD